MQANKNVQSIQDRRSACFCRPATGSSVLERRKKGMQAHLAAGCQARVQARQKAAQPGHALARPHAAARTSAEPARCE